MVVNGGGAAYSRFAEEMDIDTLDLKVQDNNRHGRRPSVKRWCGFHRKPIGAAVSVVSVFIIGVIVGHFAHFTMVPHCEVRRPNSTQNDSVMEPTEEPAPSSNYSQILHELIDTESLDSHLKRYTQQPHYAGAADSENIVADIKNAWTVQGFEVYTRSYDVLLSRPNTTVPSRLDVFGESRVFGNSPYFPNDVTDDSFLPGFNPYSANTEIFARLIYVNYGRVKDFRHLRDNGNIPPDSHICLIRLGKLSITNIIKNCREEKGVALIVFPDALHYAPNITRGANSDSWWLPANATIRDQVRMGFGDPLTPFLPSLDYGTLNATILHPNESSGAADNIIKDVNIFPRDFPVQVIGYEQARRYLTTMSYPVAPQDWQGVTDKDHTFRVGPGFENHALKFKMTVNNVLKKQTITNVFGMIKGQKEPDRYVIVGNHRDSLTYGGVEPGTGMACLMELSRVLGALYEQGWRPRRTIILASWDAGEDGNIGSAEWVEENVEVLRERAIAYINLDGAVEGNYTFSAAGSPLLAQIMYYATKRVNCPDAAHSNMKIYNNWAQKKPSQRGALIEPLGLGNDAAPFLHVAGVPSVDLRYTYDKEFYGDIPTYPVKHTGYDSYDYVKRFIDPTMRIHAAVTEVAAEAVVSLADDPLLNVQVVNYADSLVEYLREIMSSDVAGFGPTDGLEPLRIVIQRFAAAAQDFQQRYYIPPDMNSPNALRELNDRVMSIDRALAGDPGKFYLPQLRHVVYGPSRSGYEGEGLAPLRRALETGKLSSDWEAVQPALSCTIARVEAALHLLTENPLQSGQVLT